LIITESRRFSLERAVSPIAGFMEFNLLFVQLLGAGGSLLSQGRLTLDTTYLCTKQKLTTLASAILET